MFAIFASGARAAEAQTQAHTQTQVAAEIASPLSLDAQLGGAMLLGAPRPVPFVAARGGLRRANGSTFLQIALGYAGGGHTGMADVALGAGLAATMGDAEPYAGAGVSAMALWNGAWGAGIAPYVDAGVRARGSKKMGLCAGGRMAWPMFPMDHTTLLLAGSSVVESRFAVPVTLYAGVVFY